MIDGNAYIAPCGALHETPSSALSEAATAAARRFIDERIAPRSCAYSGSDGSPGFGGRTISPTAICPIVFEHSPIETSLSSCACTSGSKPASSK